MQTSPSTNPNPAWRRWPECIWLRAMKEKETRERGVEQTAWTGQQTTTQLQKACDDSKTSIVASSISLIHH